MEPRPRFSIAPAPGALGALLSALSLPLLGGCYQHVVKERGIGPGAKQIYEPNVAEETDDDPWNRGSSSSPSMRNWRESAQSKQR